MSALLEAALVVKKQAFFRALLESSMSVLPSLLELQAFFLALLEKPMLVPWSLLEL